MLIFSHRGYHKEHKDNTLAAFRSALDFAIDGIETDVRRTADHIPILYHDRLAPGLMPVAELTHAELNRAVGFSVPALSEVLSKWSRIIWNLEIKTPDAVESTLKVLAPYRTTRRVIVTSFFHDILARTAASLDMECGAVIAHKPLDLKELLGRLRDLDERINIIVLPFELLTKDTIPIARRQGFKTFVYDVGLPADFTVCHSLKADAVITDHLDRIPVETVRSSG